MPLTPDHHNYLILHKLQPDEIPVLEWNLKDLLHFKMSTSVYLVATELPIETLFEKLIKSVKDKETINLMYLPYSSIYGAFNLDPNAPATAKTIFEKKVY